MKNNRRAVPGITIIAVLLVVILLMNDLLSSFGDTLSSYLGGGTTVTSTDDSTAVLTDDEALAEGREMVTELEGEGAVLLRNENNTLPLEKGAKVTILGAMSYNYINGGAGSAGGKYDEYTYTMYEAFTGTKDDGSDSVSTELYLDVNEKAWEWLEQAVGGGRNMDTTEDYYGHTGTGELATPALGTSEYTYETYENGVKVTKTVTKYVGGASYLAYSEEENWEGLTQDDERYLYDDVYENHVIENDKVYYVVVDDNGDPVQDADGNYQLTTEETSMRLDVSCPILKEVDYDNEIWAYLVDQLSLDEDITAASSMGWQTPAIESVNKEQTSVVDGPGEAGNGNNSYGTSTWFTSAVVNASTWNPNLLYKMGVVYAHQSIKNGLSGAYAPAMNTHRTPFGGRNFEYFSEDGFLGGTIGAAEVSGIQSQGISVFIKHMALNDNDTNRDGAITWFSEQAAREIYLKDYEISVKYSYVYDEETDTGSFVYGEGALGIMGSLNRDGISMFHQGLYKNILRGEWGFNGMVITDGVGPYAWVMSPGAGLFGGVEGQLGGSAVSAYYEYEGNSTATNYGRYLLRQAAKHMLYQYCHTGGTSASSVTVTKDESWKNFWIAGNVILGAGILVTAIACFVLPAVNKKKYATVSGEAVAAGGDTIVIPEKEPSAISKALDKVFHFTERGSTMSGEIWAGLGAFFISVCALIMNTQIIGTAYGNYAGSYLAVTLIAFAGTVLLGALCNLPLVQSASMGLSTILISMIGVDTGLTYANLMLVTFVAAVVYLIVVVTPARKVLVDAIPDGVKKALPVAMGLYIVITGLQNAGIISEGTLVSASSLTTLNNFYFWLMIGATVVYLLFKAFKVKRSATKTFGILIACMWVGLVLLLNDFQLTPRGIARKAGECALFWLLSVVYCTAYYMLIGGALMDRTMMAVLLAVYALFVSRYKPVTRIVRCFVYFSSTLLMIPVSEPIGELIKDNINAEYTWAEHLTSVVMILATALVVLFLRRYSTEKLTFIPRYTVWLVVVSASLSGILVMLSDALEIGRAFKVPTMASLWIIELMSYYMFYIVNQEYERNLELVAIGHKEELEEELLQFSRDNYEEMHQIRHEIKNHLAYLQVLAEQGEYEKLKDYLHTVSGETEELFRFV
ncbi:MAG: hypothetical protein LUH16_04805, partial [Clostridiales bacterium]|nr:hypothetical protein [Clostridiales bacterium]